MSRTEAFTVQRKVERLLNFCANNPVREGNSRLAEFIEKEVNRIWTKKIKDC